MTKRKKPAIEPTDLEMIHKRLDGMRQFFEDEVLKLVRSEKKAHREAYQRHYQAWGISLNGYERKLRDIEALTQRIAGKLGLIEPPPEPKRCCCGRFCCED